MRTRGGGTVLTAALAALTAGCLAVTINVVFPQEKIEGAAASIEDLVRQPPKGEAAPGGAAPARPGPPAAAPGPKSERPGPRLATLASDLAGLLAPRAAQAQQRVPELRVRTPEVMAAINSRRDRYPRVAALVGQGCLGESNQGLVEPRPGPGCPPDVGQVAAAENRDRMLIYRTLVQQNNMPPEDLARVQAAFAKTNRERAPAGAWVQDEQGRWVKK